MGRGGRGAQRLAPRGLLRLFLVFQEGALLRIKRVWGGGLWLLNSEGRTSLPGNLFGV